MTTPDREALIKIRAHTSYANTSVELLTGLLASIERIADAALLAAETPRRQDDPAIQQAREQPVCPYPDQCCRELSRVWAALGITSYNGKSASENVAELVACRQSAEAEMTDLKGLVWFWEQATTRQRERAERAEATLKERAE